MIGIIELMQKQQNDIRNKDLKVHYGMYIEPSVFHAAIVELEKFELLKAERDALKAIIDDNQEGLDRLADSEEEVAALKSANAELVEAIRAFHYAYATGNASTDQAVDGLFKALQKHGVQS